MRNWGTDLGRRSSNTLYHWSNGAQITSKKWVTNMIQKSRQFNVSDPISLFHGNEYEIWMIYISSIAWNGNLGIKSQLVFNNHWEAPNTLGFRQILRKRDTQGLVWDGEPRGDSIHFWTFLALNNAEFAIEKTFWTMYVLPQRFQDSTSLALYQ